MIPFIILFGLYVQFHGDFGPGGRFQAGVIIEKCLLGLYSALNARKVVPAATRVLLAFGVLLYGGTGVAFFLGGNPLATTFWPTTLWQANTSASSGRSRCGHHRCRHYDDPLFCVCRPGPRLMELFGLLNYWLVIVLMMIGFYIVIAQGNLVKKMVGLSIFQVSVFVFYISVGRIEGGTAPILADGIEVFSNPLPHVLILTAIVVGVATTALGLAMIVRIRDSYGTIEDDEIWPLRKARTINDFAHLPILPVIASIIGFTCLLFRRTTHPG